MTALETDLRISCFGELRVECAGREITPSLPGRQGRALFAYLVLRESRPVPRDELFEVLWPSSPPADPEAAFRSVLAKVRRALDPIRIVGRDSLALRLPPNASVDVREVAEAVEQAEASLAAGDAEASVAAARSALDVLARPLLPALSGDWAASARAWASGLEARALEAVARAGLSLGGHHLAAAERAAAALVEHEPYREDGYGLVMEVQARRGNAAEALLTFERLRVRLREKLGTHPSAPIVALHDRILLEEHEPPGSPPTPGAFPLPAVTPRTREGAFVGRDEHLDRLRACWLESSGGRTSLVLLLGEAGVGKTRLAARFADEVHQGGGAVLYGRAEAEALLPYQPFAEALRHLVENAGPEFASAAEEELAVLNRLFPNLGPLAASRDLPTDHDALRYQVFQAVAALLTRAGARWPLLLVLDDLHWADQPTLLLLRHVLRGAEGSRLLVVGTFRREDVSSHHPLKALLADLRRERRYDRIAIDGLDEESTRALVTDRLAREVSSAFVRRLREQTRGNAFFIEETVRALDDAGVTANAVVDADALDRVGVPEGVKEVIVRRVHQLSPLASELLTAASAVGRSFAISLVEQLVDADRDAVIAALDESVIAGLVLEAEDRPGDLTFPHALVRDVVYDQVTGIGRTRLHLRIAQALERLAKLDSVNPGELAHHFDLARGLAGAGPARQYWVAAGRRAAELFAYEESVNYYRRALELFEQDVDEHGRCEALLALGRVEWHAGDDGARETFLEAAESAERRGETDQLCRAALGLGERYFEVTYLGSRYRDLLEKAIRVQGPGDSSLRALLLSRLAANRAFPNEDQKAHELAEDAVAMARRIGDTDLLAAVLLARHVTLLDVRYIDQRLELGEELESLSGSHYELRAEAHHWRFYDLLHIGDLEGARRQSEALSKIADRLDQPLFRALAEGAFGLWAELEGDTERAERHAYASRDQAYLAKQQDAVSSWASQLFAQWRREGAERLKALEPYVRRLAGSGGHQLGWRGAHAVLLHEAGNVDEARQLYEQELVDGPHGLPHGMFWLTRMALVSELCAKLGDVARAEALYTELAPHAARNVVVAYCSFWGPVDGYLALLAETAGDPRQAARHARSALDRTRAIDAPLLTRDLEARFGDLVATADPPTPARQNSHGAA